MARFDRYLVRYKHYAKLLDASFDEFGNQILKEEGGFVNDPNDPAGATNKGITLATFMQYGHDYNRDGKIDVSDLRLLTNTDALAIYKRQYWDAMYGDKIIDQSFADLYIDHGINAGMSRATKMLQYLLNVYYHSNVGVDGVMGTQTLTALNSVLRRDPQGLFSLYKSLRENYYLYLSKNTLTNPNFQIFLSTLVTPSTRFQSFIHGWLNRLAQFTWTGTAVAVGGGIFLLAGIGIFLYATVKR